ncbi:uncharacterized protein LOC125377949 [Haliotis rufescens]|uniref:uncharacterized protein LOC125377949 n=1 Tax=Haliotis rufescens TaxID=6454 RepID=UPI00201EC715|nr:uncharacterized protein LOC125377949 [Haliotis rufescens]
MNVRKHVKVQLVNSAKRLKKLCAEPTFDAFKIFNPDLAAVHLKKTTLFLNQPLCAGFSILDLSKIHMYDFHYNFIKRNYGEKAQLCFTDTDSLCYEIETHDLTADIQENIDLFDISNYKSNHPLYSKTNENVLGKFKDCETSRDHQLYTASINKISLSPFDDKRYVLNDGIHTLAHGHYKIDS